jgi:aminopeptidase N
VTPRWPENSNDQERTLGNGTEDLQCKTLAQLEALRAKLTSADWQIQMMNCSAAEQGQNANLLILLDARIAQLEDVQFAQIQRNIDACQAELNDAIVGVQNALTDMNDVGKVLAAASTLLNVVGQVVAVVAL